MRVAPPLADLRVVAVEQYGAGPWATMQLADLGAEVVKVEDPGSGGDVGRYVPPYQEGADSLFFESFNRGKRSVALDLREEVGRQALRTLVADADAVFSNLRGDGAAKLGLRYEDLREINERIVCCSLSAFGTDGPRAGEGGYDFTIQGLAGWQSITGGPDSRRPERALAGRLQRRLRRRDRVSSPRSGEPAPAVAAATSTSPCSRSPWRSSTTSPPGSPPGGMSRSGASARGTSRWSRSATSRPPTSGS